MPRNEHWDVDQMQGFLRDPFGNFAADDGGELNRVSTKRLGGNHVRRPEVARLEARDPTHLG
jgi:hypothetical protein